MSNALSDMRGKIVQGRFTGLWKCYIIYTYWLLIIYFSLIAVLKTSLILDTVPALVQTKFHLLLNIKRRNLERFLNSCSYLRSKVRGYFICTLRETESSLTFAFMTFTSSTGHVMGHTYKVTALWGKTLK